MEVREKVKPKYSFFKNFILFQPPWRDIIQFLLLAGFFGWLIYLSSTRLEYKWQWYRIPKYVFQIKDGHLVAGRLIQGLLFTFKISGVSLIFTFIFGLGTALLRLSGSFTGRLLSRLYLELIRNTPLLVQIYLIYFVLGPIIGLDRYMSAVLALSLFEGAYSSEIFRAGIVSIHKGQWEAAYSLGLSGFDMYRDIILPQATRRILPPLTSQVITLIKDSALVSLVALSDLTLEAKILASDTFLTFEIWFTAAAIYLVVTVTLSTIVSLMEKRFQIRT
ncbi:MAG: amino acid ABC transporter permease [Spirochaetes bacterium]|nr:MAG: amino acid ABC transporter permease [Spirochaetota bacterium]